MSVLIAIETVVLVLLTVLVAGLLRSHADILRRLHALDDGGETPTAARTRAAALDGRRCARRHRREPRRRRGARRGRGHGAPHAARVLVERLPHVPRVLGRVRRHRRARPAARRPPRRRHQGRDRGEHRRRCATSRRRRAGRDVERGVGRRTTSGLAVLRARRRRVAAVSKARAPARLAAGAQPDQCRRAATRRDGPAARRASTASCSRTASVPATRCSTESGSNR